MEVAFSAFVGELAQRSISFFIGRLLAKQEEPAMTPEEALRRKLLRLHVVVEEAEGRQITSRSMLEQLKLLREGMHRGYFVLDSFKYRSCQEPESRKDNGGDLGMTRSFALSKVNPAKRLQLRVRGSSRGAMGEDDLRRVVVRLDTIVADAREFALFLAGCPRLRRQPHDTYIRLERCMFGRHVEMEHVINFLLQRGTGDLEVLPILGPSKAGKSTLVEHACNDERVRRAFSRIVFLTQDDLAEEDRGTVKHESRRRLKDDKILVILELEGDIDGDAWRKLHSAWKRNAAGDRKMIISSRSDKIARFGTAQALRVRFLTPEPYWYFFKSLAFGSTDPEAEPKLASLAMELAADLNGSFVLGNIITSLLRANFSAKFWRMALSSVRECRQRYPFLFGALPVSPWQLTEQAQVRRFDRTDEYFAVSDDHQIVSASVEAPVINMQEVLTGSVVLPDGKFEALAWRSPIPPYYSYVFTCEMHTSHNVSLSGTNSFRISDTGMLI